MSYKVKSLIYFACFMASAIMYYNLESDFNTETKVNTIELAEADTDKLTTSRILKPGDIE